MKRIYLLFALAFLMHACQQTPKENFGKPSNVETNDIISKGKDLFFGVGMCHTCHKTDQKVIGPSITEIVKIYKEKNASIVSFLKGDLEPIVDQEQYEIMKANLAITKKMSDQELQAIEAYMLSVVP